MTISPFDHPVLSALFVDEEVAMLFSFEAELRGMLRFEAALAKAEAAAGLVPVEAADRIAQVCSDFVPDLPSLREAIARDGVVVPDLVRQVRAAVGKPAADHVYMGATSQDVIDTSLVLRLKEVCEILSARLALIESVLADMKGRFGARTLMGYTRMQAAIPITVGDRIGSWAAPIGRHRERLADYSDTSFVVQFGGAAGTLEKLGGKAPDIRARLAGTLGLVDAPQWHSQRDRLAELAGLLSLITGTLGKIGIDVALLAQAGDEISLTGGGGSSAMAHKQNPVAAEALVALARYNDAQISVLHSAMLHEQERSGAAWMLEWLALPSMVMATGVSLTKALQLLGNVASLGQPATE